MTFSGLLAQMLNGLAGASSLFLIAAGLSLIFGVTRIVNFAHGSLYMIGIYVAYSVSDMIGGTALGFWASILLSGIIVAIFGALVEFILLRRIYRSPELFQLLATFALVLVIRDAVIAFWGPEDLFGPKAPGLDGSVEILGRLFPQYDLVLIAVGPLVLFLLWGVLKYTRWGTLVRAATEDREMVGALGVNQAWLFTSVFALGAFLAGIGGALQLPREPANQDLDLLALGDAFVVVVVGGMGSIPGAFLAALLISELKALCIALGQVTIGGVEFSFSKLTLVVEFLVMALVLIWRPWGLLGKPSVASRNPAEIEMPLRAATWSFRNALIVLIAVLAVVPMFEAQFPYAMVLLVDLMIAVLFATSLHFIMGPGGMHSFGHAAYFGLGAYGAALLMKYAGLPMELALIGAPFVAGIGAIIFGWFAVRLTGVYLAMLTLALGQIVWSIVFQWDDVTGGSNGMIGIWPSERFSEQSNFYWLTLALTVIGVAFLWRVLHAPFGYAMRAVRDSPLRADAIGMSVHRIQWIGFIIAGTVCGMAGAMFAFSKGSISPDLIGIGRSIDGLAMVLLGGVQTLIGPVVGASLFVWLEDVIARETEYWRAMLGLAILVLVVLFPGGVAGSLKQYFVREVADK